MKSTAKKVESLIVRTQKDSKIRYRHLFEEVQEGILILDAKTGMIEYVNPYLIIMLGYSREEFVEKKLWEAGAFKDIEASQVALEALQEKEYIRYEDLPLKTKDGGWSRIPKRGTAFSALIIQYMNISEDWQF